MTRWTPKRSNDPVGSNKTHEEVTWNCEKGDGNFEKEKITSGETSILLVYGYNPNVLADPHEESASIIISSTAPPKSVHPPDPTALADA